MMNEIQKQFGDLKSSIYDFEEMDDVLPMHNHPFELTHITIIGRGSFLAKGRGWQRTVKAGDIIDFEDGQEHEFIALEPNSRLINIVKHK